VSLKEPAVVDAPLLAVVNGDIVVDVVVVVVGADVDSIKLVGRLVDTKVVCVGHAPDVATRRGNSDVHGVGESTCWQ
jgi:hypothetical protein